MPFMRNSITSDMKELVAQFIFAGKCGEAAQKKMDDLKLELDMLRNMRADSWTAIIATFPDVSLVEINGSVYVVDKTNNWPSVHKIEHSDGVKT